MNELRQWVRALIENLGHRAEHFAHMTYLGMVGLEGHGGYRWAALVLLVVVVANLVVGEGE